jgi:hypothetical protein
MAKVQKTQQFYLRFVFCRHLIRAWARTQAILTKDFRNFPQSFQVYYTTIPCTSLSLRHLSVRVIVTSRLTVYRQSVCLSAKPLETQGQNFFFQLNTCGHSPYVTSSLTRGWICRLQLLLVLASAFIFRSESRRTHDHILLSQIQGTLFLLSFISHYFWRHIF